MAAPQTVPTAGSWITRKAPKFDPEMTNRLIPPTIADQIKRHLIKHEHDIAAGMNDRGDLAQVFQYFIGRPANTQTKRNTPLTDPTKTAQTAKASSHVQ